MRVVAGKINLFTVTLLSLASPERPSRVRRVKRRCGDKYQVIKNGDQYDSEN